MGRHLLSLLALFAVLAFAPTAGAAEIAELITALGRGGFADREKAVTELATAGDPRATAALEALNAGRLFTRKSDGAVLIGVGSSGSTMIVLTDPLTAAAQGSVAEPEIERIRVNNRLRRVIESALGSLTLLNPDPKIRRQAAVSVFKSRDPAVTPILDQALAAEQIPGIKTLLRQARAAVLLQSDAAESEKIEAIAVVGSMGSREALSLLSQLRNQSDGAVRNAAAAQIREIERSLAVWEALQNVWYGLSLGSVLLLAAIGLAITFGVMGVINMAHGEMVMIGAYTTFVVQDLIRSSAPGLFDYSLIIALPLAFVIAGAIGILIERGIIRYLYGRSLETLLATWGLSLILQQTVRSIFGPTNREVGAPSWMAGSFELGQMTITYGRLWIVVFTLFVFGLLFMLLQRTFFGLAVRAVTQNRPMAAAMGIRTPWVDAFTFGLGSGIAGIAGVALSQIDNVSPNLGQGYIIDSFMVVVFGGVGNLWGTLVGALTLGVANKLLEPYAGAVLGKILVLVAIILFIQKRPRGLFALRGRAVES